MSIPQDAQEVCEEFKDHLDAVYNTGLIADMCEFKFQTGKLFFPKFEIPAGTYYQVHSFKHLCHEGFERLKSDGRIELAAADIYKERLELEIDLNYQNGIY